MVSVRNTIDASYIDRISALSVGEKRGGQAVSRAIRGNSSESRIQSTFRFGAQFYAQALSGINFTASLLNFARSDLEQIGSITGRMIEITEEAAEPNTSKQRRATLNRSLQKLGNQIEDIQSGAVTGETEYLTRSGLRDVFEKIGLNPKELSSVKGVLDSFLIVDQEENLASPEIKGQDTDLPNGAGLPDAAQFTDNLFSSQRDILDQANAQAVLDDLHALSNQIEVNMEALDNTATLLLEHTVLVRSASLAMLSLTEQIDGEVDAFKAADLLGQAIANSPREALTHIESLEPIIVAALTLEESGLISESES